LKGLKEFKRADSLLHVHYQNFGDVKILLNALDALNRSLKEGITSSEGEEKNMFKKVVNVYRIGRARKLSSEMSKTLKEYQESSLCFSRKEKYIVCDSNLGFKEINFKLLENYFQKVGKFLKNEGVVTNA
jgi:hypothetical protein